MKPRCAAFICRDTSPPSRPASEASCLPTAAGTASNAPPANGCSPKSSNRNLGFEGFLISDYNAIGQIKPGDYKTSVEISINAGMDMAMEPTNYRNFFNTLKELVKEGKVPMSRIDDAVTRILRVKFAMGLMDKNRSQLADRKLHATFGSAGAPGGGARSGAKIAGAAEERTQDAAAVQTAGPHSRCRQERRQYRQPVRRLDNSMAGADRQCDSRRNDHSRSDQGRGVQEDPGDVFAGRHGSGRRGDGNRRHRRKAVCGRSRRSLRSFARQGRPRGDCQCEKGRNPGGGDPDFRAAP